MLRISTITLSILLFSYIVYSIRRKSLKERYVAVWIPIGIISILVAIFPNSIRIAAKILGFQVPSNLLLLGAVIFLTVIVFQLTSAVSKTEKNLEKTVIDLALLRDQIDHGL